MTLIEENELELIKDGLKFKDITGRWTAKYPWLKDQSSLSDDRCVALATLHSMERRLQKDKLHVDTYQKHIEDMIHRKVAREVIQKELAEYRGAINSTYHILTSLNQNSKALL